MFPKGLSLLVFVLAAAMAIAQASPQSPPAATPVVPPLTFAREALPDAPSASLAAQPVTGDTAVRHAPTLADPYLPLTSRGKFVRWVHSAHSPSLIPSVLFSAGWAHATGNWSGYGGGMEGFGKRLGASVADAESSRLLKVFVLPTLLHQDPRYFAMRQGGAARRGWYAVSRVLVTRRDDGRNTFNTSEVAGVLMVHGLQNAYIPERNRTLAKTMSSSAGAFLSDALNNGLREFWPEIRRLLRRTK